MTDALGASLADGPSRHRGFERLRFEFIGRAYPRLRGRLTLGSTLFALGWAVAAGWEAPPWAGPDDPR